MDKDWIDEGSFLLYYPMVGVCCAECYPVRPSDRCGSCSEDSSSLITGLCRKSSPAAYGPTFVHPMIDVDSYCPGGIPVTFLRWGITVIRTLRKDTGGER